VIAPKERGSGKIEIKVDGKVRATADVATTGKRRVQQVVYEIRDLNADKHSISIVNRGNGKVSVDALIVR
jgi:hypothetical protein